MFFNFKRLASVAIILVILNTYPVASAASQTRENVSCDGDDCSAILTDGSYSTLCDSPHFFAFWKKTDADQMILQCPCDCAMESNTNWLIDSRRTNVYAFTTGRFVSKSFIAKVAAGADIPDRFGGTKLCGGPKKEKLEQSTFVLLFKHPHNDSFPYCYEIGYITYENERFSVYRNSGKVLAGDRNYWLAPVSKRDKSYLLSIWRNVLRNH